VTKPGDNELNIFPYPNIAEPLDVNKVILNKQPARHKMAETSVVTQTTNIIDIFHIFECKTLIKKHHY
jgi:hypothetical protein